MRGFVLDSMLGKLVKILRVLGYSADFVRDGFGSLTRFDPDFLYVTRRRSFSGRPGFVVVRENNPYRQLMELRDMGLVSWRDDKVFTRCIECNHTLERLEREDAFGLVPDFVYRTCVRFARCPQCGRVYWEGTHTENMTRRLKELLGVG